MNSLPAWIIFSWVALPTVMYGGYSRLRLINQDDALSAIAAGATRTRAVR